MAITPCFQVVLQLCKTWMVRVYASTLKSRQRQHLPALEPP